MSLRCRPGPPAAGVLLEALPLELRRPASNDVAIGVEVVASGPRGRAPLAGQVGVRVEVVGHRSPLRSVQAKDLFGARVRWVLARPLERLAISVAAGRSFRWADGAALACATLEVCLGD